MSTFSTKTTDETACGYRLSVAIKKEPQTHKSGNGSYSRMLSGLSHGSMHWVRAPTDCQFCQKMVLAQRPLTEIEGEQEYMKITYEEPEKGTGIEAGSTFFYMAAVQRSLYNKYSSSQNYYYTKDINEIISGNRCSATINVKDLNCLYESEEYLKRFYKMSEYQGKVKLLSEYYKFHKDISRLYMLPTTIVLNKYHDRKRRVEYVKITRILKSTETEGSGPGGANSGDEFLRMKQEDEAEFNQAAWCRYEKHLKIRDESHKPSHYLVDHAMPSKASQNAAPANWIGTLNKNKEAKERPKEASCSNTIQDLNQRLGEIICSNSRVGLDIGDPNDGESFTNLGNFLNFLRNNDSDFTQNSMAQGSQVWLEGGASQVQVNVNEYPLSGNAKVEGSRHKNHVLLAPGFSNRRGNNILVDPKIVETKKVGKTENNSQPNSASANKNVKKTGDLGNVHSSLFRKSIGSTNLTATKPKRSQASGGSYPQSIQKVASKDKVEKPKSLIGGNRGSMGQEAKLNRGKMENVRGNQPKGTTASAGLKKKQEAEWDFHHRKKSDARIEYVSSLLSPPDPSKDSSPITKANLESFSRGDLAAKRQKEDILNRKLSLEDCLSLKRFKGPEEKEKALRKVKIIKDLQKKDQETSSKQNSLNVGGGYSQSSQNCSGKGSLQTKTHDKGGPSESPCETQNQNIPFVTLESCDQDSESKKKAQVGPIKLDSAKFGVTLGIGGKAQVTATFANQNKGLSEGKRRIKNPDVTNSSSSVNNTVNTNPSKSNSRSSFVVTEKKRPSQTVTSKKREGTSQSNSKSRKESLQKTPSLTNAKAQPVSGHSNLRMASRVDSISRRIDLFTQKKYSHPLINPKDLNLISGVPALVATEEPYSQGQNDLLQKKEAGFASKGGPKWLGGLRDSGKPAKTGESSHHQGSSKTLNTTHNNSGAEGAKNNSVCSNGSKPVLASETLSNTGALVTLDRRSPSVNFDKHESIGKKPELGGSEIQNKSPKNQKSGDLTDRSKKMTKPQFSSSPQAPNTKQHQNNRASPIKNSGLKETKNSQSTSKGALNARHLSLGLATSNKLFVNHTSDKTAPANKESIVLKSGDASVEKKKALGNTGGVPKINNFLGERSNSTSNELGLIHSSRMASNYKPLGIEGGNIVANSKSGSKHEIFEKSRRSANSIYSSVQVEKIMKKYSPGLKNEPKTQGKAKPDPSTVKKQPVPGDSSAGNKKPDAFGKKNSLPSPVTSPSLHPQNKNSGPKGSTPRFLGDRKGAEVYGVNEYDLMAMKEMENLRKSVIAKEHFKKDSGSRTPNNANLFGERCSLKSTGISAKGKDASSYKMSLNGDLHTGAEVYENHLHIFVSNPQSRKDSTEKIHSARVITASLIKNQGPSLNK